MRMYALTPKEVDDEVLATQDVGIITSMIYLQQFGCCLVWLSIGLFVIAQIE